MTYEDYLRFRLQQLEMQYRKEAQPILDELYQIELMKPMKPITITTREWEAITGQKAG